MRRLFVCSIAPAFSLLGLSYIPLVFVRSWAPHIVQHHHLRTLPLPLFYSSRVSNRRLQLVNQTRKTVILQQSFSVPASSLEQGLSEDERTTVRVVRNAGPSVAYVTSVLTLIAFNVHANPDKNSNHTSLPPSAGRDYSKDTLPSQGQLLGSGSGFVVNSAGYLCTNFHVIEAAYRFQQSQLEKQQRLTRMAGNLSSIRGSSSLRTGNESKCMRLLSQLPPTVPGAMASQVYVRIDSLTRYRACRIVDVVPELDVAVLKIVNDLCMDKSKDTAAFKSLTFGESSSLLVGQQLIAIGNPFGLDNSVTTGVVSALNREIQVRSRGGRGNRIRMIHPPGTNTIRNCIQTDCAINPGNSGGPLLNRQGKVVGMNTAIVTTSGSSAGIGFAVPSDLIEPVVQKIIRVDQQQLRPSAYLGVSIVKCPFSSAAASAAATALPLAILTEPPLLAKKNWICRVELDSPADKAGMKSLRIDENGRVEYGDAIVAVGGNTVNTFRELMIELDQRKVREQLQVTLEDKLGNRRVVSLTLDSSK